MQVIADYFGYELHRLEGHVGVKHRVYTDDSFPEWKGRLVNSFHNYSVVEKEDGELDIIARSSADDEIEALRHKELRIYGTMWHPERNHPFDNSDISFMKGIFGGCL